MSQYSEQMDFFGLQVPLISESTNSFHDPSNPATTSVFDSILLNAQNSFTALTFTHCETTIATSGGKLSYAEFQSIRGPPTH